MGAAFKTLVRLPVWQRQLENRFHVQKISPFLRTNSVV
jgi:hypothetical protein